ncbi:MAG: TonB-dependent receptor [Telluria sp.]
MNFHTKRLQRSAITVAIGLLISSVAYAQSSEGSIFGRGKPGDKVTITSVDSNTTRQVTVDSSGAFSLAKLPPGTYRVVGNGVSKEVSVDIGSGTNVSLVADDTQRVVISRVRSAIDVSSVESNTVFTAEQMQALPVGRDANSFALLAPGVVKGDADLGVGGLPSFGGASVAENGYYINGFDVTNIRNFLTYSDLPFDAVGAQQIKSGGYGAEFGRSLGGVISLVTKRGTNTWKGGAAVYWEPEKLRSPGKNVRDIDHDDVYTVFRKAREQTDLSYNVFGGGPLIKDKLFIFALAEGRRDTYDTFGETSSLHSKSSLPRGMVKIDFTPTDAHRLELTAISNKKREEVIDYEPKVPRNLTNHRGPGTVSQINSGGDILIGKYTGYLTDALTVSALAGSVNQKVETTTGARTANQTCPVVLETNLDEIGCWAKPFPGEPVRAQGSPDDADKRRAFRFDVDYALGNHALRAGIDHQKFTSSEAGSSTFSGGYYYRYFISTNGTVNGVPNVVAPGGQYVRRREVTSTSGAFDTVNSAFYVEDNWKITKDVLLYAGLRSESFDNKDADGTSFVKADNLLAPRLGASWDVRGDSSLKVYANAGRYYIPVAVNTNIRATRGELSETRYYTFTGRDPISQGPLGMGGQIGIPQIVGDGSLPNPATIADTKLKPMSQDEFILGFQKAIAKGWSVGAKATHRKINNGMDDYCSHVGFERWAADNNYANFDSSTMAQCIMVNPGNDVNLQVDVNNDGKLKAVTIPAKYLGLAKYTRVYNALELTLDRPYDGTWGVNASYTWSKVKGTAEGYVNSVINQEDAGVTQDFDFGSLTHGSDGFLANDRRHVFKAYGNYSLSREFRIGFNATVASGRPISCIGFVPESVPDFVDAGNYSTASSYYCLNNSGQSVLTTRGTSGRTPWTGTLDLQLAYLPAINKGKLTIQADVFNVFNTQKVTEVNETRDFSRDTVGEGQLNQNYLQPTSFQTPRSVRLTARYEF